MGAQGFLTAFALLSCLGAGVLCLQGVAAARYRGERLNVAAAGVALVCAVVALGRGLGVLCPAPGALGAALWRV